MPPFCTVVFEEWARRTGIHLFDCGNGKQMLELSIDPAAEYKG